MYHDVYTGYRAEDDPWERRVEIRGLDLWSHGKATLQQHGGILGWVKDITGEMKDAATFAVYCNETKDHSRPTISTTINKGCGGYAAGRYVYMFQFDDIHMMLMPKYLLGQGWKDEFQLEMYFEASKNIETSTVLGINLNLPTTEVVFLTPIKPNNIVGYWTPQGVWHQLKPPKPDRPLRK